MSRLNVLCVLMAILLPSCALSSEVITWTNDGVELAGTLTVPKSEGPHPLVVFIQGSGCVERDSRSNRRHASRLADMGIASFMYDKRGCGDSGGDWKTVGLETLASDLMNVLGWLASHPRIDSTRFGLMGLSQGAWVALIAASQSEHVSFVIWLSGPSMTPAEQGVAILRMRLERAGWDEDSIAEAIALEEMVLNVYRTEQGWEEAQRSIDVAQEKPWFPDARIGIQARDSWNWRWYSNFPIDHDPVPALRTLDTPLLAIYGDQDAIVPSVECKSTIDELAAIAPAPRNTVMLTNVGHDLGGRRAKWPDAYWDALANWFHEIGVLH